MKFFQIKKKLNMILPNYYGIKTGEIFQINNDDFVVLLDGYSANFSPSQSIEFSIPSNECLVKFYSDVIKVNGQEVSFSLPKDVRYIQRRQYSRVEHSVPVEAVNINTTDKYVLATKNISGGGLKIISDKKFKVGCVFDVSFNVMENMKVKTLLKILRVEPNKLKENEYYLSGQFIEISEKDRFLIIQATFKRQLELKCKGINSTFDYG